MIRCLDGPKTYWGYYQDYLIQIYGKKIPKKIASIFSKNPKGIVWRKKMAKQKWQPIFNFGPKIEWMHPVEYVDANVDANMDSSYGLTCL